jgi:hypothetical protein
VAAILEVNLAATRTICLSNGYGRGEKLIELLANDSIAFAGQRLEAAAVDDGDRTSALIDQSCLM